MKYLVIFLAIISCSGKNEYVEITLGKDEIPEIGRQAIRFHQNLSAFYVIEKNNNLEYYTLKINNKEWESVKNLITTNESLKVTNIPPNVMISDGKRMDICYSINDNKKSLRYELGFLPKKINSSIDSIFNNIDKKVLKKCEKIMFNSDILK